MEKTFSDYFWRKNDIFPEHNEGLTIVPQILTNQAEYFILTCKNLEKYGYNEVNINLGCPSKTVTTKGKGAGFLLDPDKLDRFFEQIFSKVSMKVSIKTRLGMEEEEEFYRLLEIYNKYPFEEMIVHPRIGEDFYKGKPRMELFQYTLKNSKHPICYNGDIFTSLDYKNFIERYPQIDQIMLGRGLLSNPGLLNYIKEDRVDKRQIKAFHDSIYEGYQSVLSGDRNVLFKMKELWNYMIHSFSDSEKIGKKIRKSQKLSDYCKVVEELFLEHEVIYENM